MAPGKAHAELTGEVAGSSSAEGGPLPTSAIKYWSVHEAPRSLVSGRKVILKYYVNSF